MATLTEFLTEIANAIRSKTGASSPIPAPNFAQEILGIQTGTDTSDATATAADILSGKIAYGASGKLTGTIPSVSGKTVTPGTAAQTAIEAGKYAAGDITVAGDANLIPGNIKSGVSLFGVSGDLSAGRYVQLTAAIASGNFLSFDAQALAADVICLWLLPSATYPTLPSGDWTIGAIVSGQTAIELRVNPDTGVLTELDDSDLVFHLASGYAIGGNFPSGKGYKCLMYIFGR